MKLFITCALIFIFSCQHRTAKQSAEIQKSETKPIDTTPVLNSPPAQAGNSPLSVKALPHFGIIFSGGGAKAWAHIGVLKEMQKYKFPIVSVVGIEWGAIVGAVFAQNLSANEVEWEMSKFKTIDNANEFISTIFAKKTVSDMKASFACPSINLKSQNTYLLNRGNVDQFLPFCVASPGLVKPYGQSVALMTDIPLLIQHLKSTGVQKVILVNVLSTKVSKPYVKSIESLENQIWVASASQLVKKNIGIDETIEINISDFSIEDFDQRREMMVKGSEIGYPQIKRMAEKYGL